VAGHRKRAAGQPPVGNYIGTEHLLLGLLGVPDGMAGCSPARRHPAQARDKVAPLTEAGVVGSRRPGPARRPAPGEFEPSNLNCPQ
jgi:hypothetical protein